MARLRTGQFDKAVPLIEQLAQAEQPNNAKIQARLQAAREKAGK